MMIYVTFVGGPGQALVSSLEHDIGQGSFTSMATASDFGRSGFIGVISRFFENVCISS